jgi:hypothetical protein
MVSWSCVVWVEGSAKEKLPWGGFECDKDTVIHLLDGLVEAFRPIPGDVVGINHILVVVVWQSVSIPGQNYSSASFSLVLSTQRWCYILSWRKTRRVLWDSEGGISAEHGGINVYCGKDRR